MMTKIMIKAMIMAMFATRMMMPSTISMTMEITCHSYAPQLLAVDWRCMNFPHILSMKMMMMMMMMMTMKMATLLMVHTEPNDQTD